MFTLKKRFKISFFVFKYSIKKVARIIQFSKIFLNICRAKNNNLNNVT